MSRIRPTAWVLHAGALLAYLAVALVLSFPLVTHLTTHFPGSAEQQDVFLFLCEALDLLAGSDTARRVDADAELIAFRIAPPSSFTSGGTR